MNWIQIKSLLLRYPPDRSYLVGVSGGRDSVALLHWLATNGYQRLILCHLNHQLRGRSSDADARFVEKLATKYNAEVVVGSENVRLLAARHKLSTETAAREARYKFFARVAKLEKCRFIFLGHQADDLVETFLINLFRGAGLAGLSGIRASSTRVDKNGPLVVLRPLLGVWRSEVDDYVRRHRLKFREDASNADLASLRNRVRHRIVPYLKKTVGRNIKQSIWRTAMIAADEEAWIENHLSDIDGDFSVRKLRELPVALQRRQIRNWLRDQNVSEIGFDVIERVRSLIELDSLTAKINLPRDRHARRRAGKIFVE